MDKLIAELRRLYLPAGAPDTQAADALVRRLRGEAGVPLGLAAPDGRVRALAMPFDRIRKAEEGEHWRQLCAAANTMQTELDLPAPGVSINGDTGYHLWLSLAVPVPYAQAQAFLALLRLACFPEPDTAPAASGAPAELPPCVNARSGKWAAFIHPGMGASFADEPGLDMAPPPAGQAAFLEGLESIAEAQFAATFDRLGRAHGAATVAEPAVPVPAPAVQSAAQSADTLLLKDATLDDIVRFLHARNIEPTFRYVLPK
jgi:hypothetical protein